VVSRLEVQNLRGHGVQGPNRSNGLGPFTDAWPLHHRALNFKRF